MHLCGRFSCGTAWSPLHEVPLQLLCPTQAALQRLWSHFSTQVKTIQEKERGGWMEGPAQPGRAVLGALGWSSLSKGTFSQVLLQICVPPGCNVCCVCALLWPCSCLAAGVLPWEGKGPFLLPWNICLCWFVLAHGTCQMLLAEKRWLSVCTRENCCFREGLRSVVVCCF